MYGAPPSSEWRLLRHIIQEKVNKGILLCPMPLEHLYETIGRSNKDKNGNLNDEYTRNIIEQHHFFCKLANGTAFYGYEEIAATEIIMLLRQGKIPTMKSIYLHKTIYAQIDISNIYKEGHAFNEAIHQYNQELFMRVNEPRETFCSLNNDLKTKHKGLTIKPLMRLQVNNYLNGLKDFCQKGYVKIRGVKCDSFELPNKVDSLIFYLTKKKINKKETEKLIQELETHGFDRIPSMNIRSLLSADIALYDKQQVPNDEIDLDRAAIGLRISDYFFTDNDKKLTIEKYKLDRLYHTKVFSGKKNQLSH